MGCYILYLGSSSWCLRPQEVYTFSLEYASVLFVTACVGGFCLFFICFYNGRGGVVI